MKKALSIILCLLLVFSALPTFIIPAAAETFTSDGYEYVFEYMLKEDGTADILYYSGQCRNLVIPSTIDGYTVTGIYYNAFC